MNLSSNTNFLTVSHSHIIIRKILKQKYNKFNTQRHLLYQKWAKVDISAF